MRRALWSLLLIPMVVFVAACGSDDDDDAAGASGGGDKDPIVIGAQLDLTGPAQFAGVAGRYGIELAIKQINENGGINGHPLELKAQDSETTPEGGALAIRKLVQEDQVDLLFSMSSSTAALGAVPVAIGLKKPFLVSGAGDPLLLEDKSPFVYRGAAASHETTSDVFAVFLKDHFQASTVGLMIETTNAGYVKLAELLKQKLPAAGMEIVDEQSFAVKDTDFTAQIQAFKESNPDVILTAGYPQAAALFLKQARAAGIENDMTGETAQSVNEMIELAGADAAENYTTLWGAPQWIEDPSGDMGKFTEAFNAEFPDAKPEHFNFLTLWAYSDVYVLAEALRNTGGDVDPQKVVDALDKITEFQAGEGSEFPYGFKVGLPRTFTPDNHEGTQTLTPLIIKGGAFEVLEEGQ